MLLWKEERKEGRKEGVINPSIASFPGFFLLKAFHSFTRMARIEERWLVETRKYLKVKESPQEAAPLTHTAESIFCLPSLLAWTLPNLKGMEIYPKRLLTVSLDHVKSREPDLFGIYSLTYRKREDRPSTTSSKEKGMARPMQWRLNSGGYDHRCCHRESWVADGGSLPRAQ